MFDMKKFAQFLSGKRREKNITQGQLADMVGVSHQAVSKWENGQSFPDVTLFPRLANLFGVSVDELMNGSETQTPTAAVEPTPEPTPDEGSVTEIE